MSNTKFNIYKKVLQEVCEKINGAEQYIKERIEALCSESKLPTDEVTYLFRNDYNNFAAVLLKSYKHHFECNVITLIFFSTLFLLQMQNVEVNNTILKTKKTKSEIKKRA